MEKDNVIEKIYRNHHSKNREEGFVLLKEERGKIFKDAIGKGEKVLDIGCRDGYLTELFCKENDVLGVDIDGELLKKAGERLGIKTKQMDLNGEWNLPNNYFDVVVAAEVIEHLYFPEEVLKKISAVLKPNGILVGSVPNAFSLKNRLRYLLGIKKNTPLSDPTHINHFSYKELKQLLNSFFDEVSIIPIGRFAFLDKFFPGVFSFGLVFITKKKKRAICV